MGTQFFVPGRSFPELQAGRPPAAPWEWTDDTEMACTVVAELRDHGEIDRDRLARYFADRCEPCRGYVDTTGAIAGWVVAAGHAGIPASWLVAREALPGW